MLPQGVFTNDIMKKSKKRIIILMIILIPVIILAIPFIIGGISIKEFPLWAIIGIPILLLASPFIFLLAQRRTERTIYDAPLQKQKKRFLTVWGIYIIFLTILLIVLYYVHYSSFVGILCGQSVCFVLLFFINFRLFFPKEKKQKLTNDNNQEEKE